jgi:hypothetical protein
MTTIKCSYSIGLKKEVQSAHRTMLYMLPVTPSSIVSYVQSTVQHSDLRCPTPAKASGADKVHRHALARRLGSCCKRLHVGCRADDVLHATASLGRTNRLI